MGMELIYKYFPEFQDVGYFFKNYLKQYITPETRLLDVGCGHQAYGAELYQIAKYRVGIDENEEALAENPLMDERIISDIEHMPEFKEKFDVVVAQFVLEHVVNPDQVAEKIAKACVKGGHFIFMTGNIYSPLMLVSKITPTFLKKILKHVFLGIARHDTFPTKYRINSIAKLDFYFEKHGFKRIEVKRVGVLTYFAFSKPVLFAKAWLDRYIFDQFKIFQVFNTHLVGIYEKVS